MRCTKNPGESGLWVSLPDFHPDHPVLVADPDDWVSTARRHRGPYVPYVVWFYQLAPVFVVALESHNPDYVDLIESAADAVTEHLGDDFHWGSVEVEEMYQDYLEDMEEDMAYGESYGSAFGLNGGAEWIPGDEYGVLEGRLTDRDITTIREACRKWCAE